MLEESPNGPQTVSTLELRAPGLWLMGSAGVLAICR